MALVHLEFQALRRRLVVGNFDGGMIGSDGGSSICAATPNAGYSFSAFSGACYGASCALTNVT
jgi:hypothetical protein